jgi:hypothetical protein
MFRFTIRDLLWLMVVVAMGVGWWVDRRENEYRMAERARQELQQVAKRAGFTFWSHYSGVYLIPLNKTVHGQPRGWSASDFEKARSGNFDAIGKD